MNGWNEWVHVGVSALGVLISSLVGLLFHDIRDRLVRSEEKLLDLGERIASIEGALGKGWNGQDRRKRL